MLTYLGAYTYHEFVDQFHTVYRRYSCNYWCEVVDKTEIRLESYALEEYLEKEYNRFKEAGELNDE